MAKSKKNYYLVYVGKQTGVYKTWSECEEQTKGYKGAKFSGFVTWAELEDFLIEHNIVINEDGSVTYSGEEVLKKTATNTHNRVHEPYEVDAYVDGSFMDKISLEHVGSGVVFVQNGEVVKTVSKCTKHTELAQQHQIGGEIIAATLAVQSAISMGFKKVTLLYDYRGIENWVTGADKAKNEYSKRYVDRINELSKSIQIEFIKVQAHTGNKFNEQADELAKSALFGVNKW